MKRWEQLAWVSLGVLAVVSRFFLLGERVPHHDEAVHAHIARELLVLGQYRYDPTYHGPLQFYILAPLFALFGQNDFVARSWAAACGVALVLAPLLLRSRVGKTTALAMGVLLLLSPHMTYYARFARNDGPVVLFSFAAVALVMAGQRSRSYALVPVGILAALHLASKETFYVYGAVMAPAFAVTLLLYRRAWPSFHQWLTHHRLALLASLAAFFAVTWTAYTVFFRFPEDVLFPLKAFAYWWGQHVQERVAGPWWYYLPRLALYEGPILALAGWYYWRHRKNLSPTWFFLLAWGVFSIAMYAYLGEKVPWLLVHQLLPWVPAAGAALGRLASRQGRVWPRVAVGACCAWLGWNTVHSSFLNSAIEPATGKAELLVYVQTVPSFKEIIEEGKSLARQTPGEIVLAVAGEAGWPLSWSWANTPVWWDKPQAGQNIQLFLCDPGQEQEIVNTLGRAYGCGEVPLRAWWVEEGPVSLRALWRWFTRRQAWSPVGYQAVTVCRLLPPSPSPAE